MKKIIFSYIISAILLGVVILPLNGCVNIKANINPNLKAPYLDQQKYSLNVIPPKSATTKSNAGNLEIFYPKVAEKYSGQNFVYKLNSYNYITDAYNIFFDLPGDQIQQIIINYLGATGQFKYVAAEIYPAKAHYALKTYINKLYADYTNRNIPKASIEIRFVLFDIQNNNNILLDKTFQENFPLKEKSSKALINAWNRGLKQILNQLNINFQKLSLEIKPSVVKPFYNPHPWRKNKSKQKPPQYT